MRLKADFWVAAYLRRCDVEGIVAVLRRRGAAEAGAVYVKLDCLDGRTALFGQATNLDVSNSADRAFMRLHKDAWLEPLESENRLDRVVRFDPDVWIVEIESRDGRTFLPLTDDKR